MSCSVNNYSYTHLLILHVGNLSAPDVDYHVGDGSILFSWSPPFSHNITNVEPDISHYLVYVYGNDLPEYTVITTKTRYILQNGNCGIKKYQVTIAAVNLVGVGEKYASPHFSIEGTSLKCKLPYNYNS